MLKRRRTFPTSEKWTNNREGSPKTSEWENVRRQLKIEFANRGITRCQRCGIDDYLSFAHRMKRDEITTVEELKTVALLCTKPYYWTNEHGERETIYGCHGWAERMSHEDMFKAIDEIIQGAKHPTLYQIEFDDKWTEESK